MSEADIENRCSKRYCMLERKMLLKMLVDFDSTVFYLGLNKYLVTYSFFSQLIFG